MAHRTILRCERECQRGRPERERQPSRERQCLEWRVSSSSRSPENEMFSSLLFGRSFLFNIFFPSTKHSSDFIQIDGKRGIFIIWQAFVFPSDLQKEFYSVQFRDTDCKTIHLLFTR